MPMRTSGPIPRARSSSRRTPCCVGSASRPTCPASSSRSCHRKWATSPGRSSRSVAVCSSDAAVQEQDMTVEERLKQIERELSYLKDRQEILDCIARHARGCDRHDPELLASAYHPDGVDEHGFAINPGPKYPEW